MTKTFEADGWIGARIVARINERIEADLKDDPAKFRVKRRILRQVEARPKAEEVRPAKYLVKVELRPSAIGAAPAVGVFFHFINDPTSINEVVEFLACHGFPVGCEEHDGIKFLTTVHGGMQKIPYNNYVAITHAPDSSPHIIYFNAETFFTLYSMDTRPTDEHLRYVDARPRAAKLQTKETQQMEKQGKTFHNSEVSGAKQNVSDLKIFGPSDTFKLISKASSANEKWMKSTKAMEIPEVGCVVQVSTQQGDNVAEALTFIPSVRIDVIGGDPKNGHRLVQIHAPASRGDVPLSYPVQDSLPAKDVAEFVDGINERHANSKVPADVAHVGHSDAHLFRGVFNARRRAAYHDMIRFEGTPESADQVIEWVNNSTDICRVVYDKEPATDSIALKWDGEYPATPINVGDLIVHVGNGHFQVRSEKSVAEEYNLGDEVCSDTSEVQEDIAPVAVRTGPSKFFDAQGREVVVYEYDGTPASAGEIVAASNNCALVTACYGRDGLSVFALGQTNVTNLLVPVGAFVVIDVEGVAHGSYQWLFANYRPDVE